MCGKGLIFPQDSEKVLSDYTVILMKIVQKVFLLIDSVEGKGVGRWVSEEEGGDVDNFSLGEPTKFGKVVWTITGLQGVWVKGLGH